MKAGFYKIAQDELDALAHLEGIITDGLTPKPDECSECHKALATLRELTA